MGENTSERLPSGGKRKIKRDDPTEMEGMRNVYCSGCGRFLLKERIEKGFIHVKCRHCKNWTLIGY